MYFKSRKRVAQLTYCLVAMGCDPVPTYPTKPVCLIVCSLFLWWFGWLGWWPLIIGRVVVGNIVVDVVVVVDIRIVVPTTTRRRRWVIVANRFPRRWIGTANTCCCSCCGCRCLRFIHLLFKIHTRIYGKEALFDRSKRITLCDNRALGIYLILATSICAAYSISSLLCKNVWVEMLLSSLISIRWNVPTTPTYPIINNKSILP